MLLTIALLTLNAAPWLELGRGADGGVEAPSIASSGKLSTALELKQVNDSGGTMHFASKTVLSCAACGRPLQLATSALIDHVVDLGESRFLLLGWSSGGGGEQSVHALLVRLGTNGPELVDQLVWSTTRADRGILIASSPEGWRIGLPQPRPSSDLDFEPSLSVTSLGRTSRRVTKLVKAGFFAPLPEGLAAFAYCPPFGEGLRVHANVGWVRITAKGFATTP